MKSYGKNTHLTPGAIYEIMKNVLEDAFGKEDQNFVSNILFSKEKVM